MGGGPRVVVSTAAFHVRVPGSVPGLGGLKETKMFLPHPRVKVSIVGSLRDREVAYSAPDRQGSNFESCVWRTVSSQSSHHPQEVLLAQFSLYVHKGGLKPDSFHFMSSVMNTFPWDKIIFPYSFIKTTTICIHIRDTCSAIINLQCTFVCGVVVISLWLCMNYSLSCLYTIILLIHCFSTLRSWDINNHKQHKASMKPRTCQGRMCIPTTCTYSRDGSLVAAACQDGSIQMWQHNRYVRITAQCRLTV